MVDGERQFTQWPVKLGMTWFAEVLSGSEVLGDPPDGFAGPWPDYAFCLCEEPEYLHCLADEAQPIDLLMRCLTEQVNHCHGRRPTKLVVSSQALAGQLSQLLADSGTRVEYQPESPVIEHLRTSLREYLLKSIESATAGKAFKAPAEQGLLHSYAEAAAAFYRSRVWRYFGQCDLLKVEYPQAVRGLKHFTVLGSGQQEFGLGLYTQENTHWEMLAQEFDMESADLASLTFDHEYDVSPEAWDAWNDGDLPLASNDAFPNWMIVVRGESVVPDDQDFRFITTLLAAMAATTEAEIDSGRWEKSVMVDGQVEKCVISIPDLLSPPSRDAWLQRRVTPDHRGSDRINKLIEGFAAQHAELDGDSLNALLTKQFDFKSPSEIEFPADTPYQRADNLYYEALENHGRRRIHLARKAIAASADHFEARLLLAECTFDPEERLAMYQQLATAWRAQNQELLEKYAGKFWQIASTRPYIRILSDLADICLQAGRTDQAIEQMQEIMRLNESDNLGMRDRLVPLLVSRERISEASEVLLKYPEESGAWLYLNALIQFKLLGAKAPAARKAMRIALEFNPNIIEFLDPDTPPYNPHRFKLGSREEAAIIVDEQSSAWHETEGFIEFLVAEAQKLFDSLIRHHNKQSQSQRPKKPRAKKSSPKKRK